MLKDSEKKVLARYALMPKLMKAAIWMIPGVILLTFLLEFINEVYTHGHGANSFGIIMTFVVIIFFVIAYFYCRSVLKNAYRNATWRAIADRIEAVYIRPSGDELSLADISKAKKSAYLSSFDQYLHEAFHIFDYYPKTMLKRVLFVVLPCLLIIGSYVPIYVNNYIDYETSRAEVSEVLAALCEAFDGYRIYCDDPYEYYSEYGYYFTAYADNGFDDYISINVLNDGSIDYISYTLTVDLSVTKEENLEDIQAKLDELYSLLASADVTMASRYLIEPTLSDVFTSAFLEDDDYLDISLSDRNMYISFYVFSMDDYDEGVLYISIF